MEAHRFEVDDLPRIAAHWDAAVDATPDVDAFCSSTIWSFSAATSFPEVAAPVVVGNGRAFCGMRATTTVEGNRILVGLDPVWGFATPLVGPPVEAAAMLAARLAQEPFELAVVAAQREDMVLTGCLARTLEGHFQLFRGPVEHRLRIDLAAGVDAWFARRSPRFRQRLRRLRREAAARGLEICDVSAQPPDALFDRILTIEARSWKGDAETGLARPDLAAFYHQICVRLGARDHLRALVARLDDRDVGFILGGVRGDTYRGLQLSYDRAVADLGVGHLLQYDQLERLTTEGITIYDLGMDMDYKRRWADRVDETISIIVRP